MVGGVLLASDFVGVLRDESICSASMELAGLELFMVIDFKLIAC